MKPTLVIGIDPGTGSSSACGFSAYELETRKILVAKNIWAIARQKPTHHRIKDVVDQVRAEIDALQPNYDTIVLGIESFILRGKGGETLQRMIGATLTALPYSIRVVEIQNTSMKKYVGGAGTADKAQVAQGVITYFKDNDHSFRVACELEAAQLWDALDSLGIAIAATGTGPKRKGSA